MKITRIDAHTLELDGGGEFVLTRNPHQFELDGVYEFDTPKVNVKNFRTYKVVCCWRHRVKATVAALKFIWGKS